MRYPILFLLAIGKCYSTISSEVEAFQSLSAGVRVPSSNSWMVRNSIISFARGGGDNPQISGTGVAVAPLYAHIEDSVEVSKATDGSGNIEQKPGFIRSLLPFFPWSKLPNYLTYMRCLAIPLLIVLYYANDYNNFLMSTIFAGASFTDWLDGYLARRWNVTSNFGAFLDPVADKLMVSTALILLSGTYGANVAIPSAVILAREIGVSALREWMAQQGQRDAVKVGFQGKVKTALTMLSLTLLLLVPHDESLFLYQKLLQPSLYALYASAIITVTSGSVYFKAAWPLLNAEN